MNWYSCVCLSLNTMPLSISVDRLFILFLNVGLIITSLSFMAHQMIVFICCISVVTFLISIAGLLFLSVIIIEHEKGSVCCCILFMCFLCEYCVYEVL